MLRKPRKLPQRFNRAVSPAIQNLANRRHRAQRQYKRQRWKRALARIERRAVEMRGVLIRLLVILFIGVIALVIGLVLFSPILAVREIRVARTDLRLETELIQESLASVFDERLPFLSVESIPPLLTADIPDRHRSAVPDLSRVTITKVYPSTLQLRLSLRPLAYRISIDSPDQKETVQPIAASGSDFLTHDGMYVVYTNAQTGTGTRLPLMHMVDWSVRPDPWKPLISQEILGTMREAGRILATEFKQGVVSRTIFLRAREIHLKLPEYEVWFDMQSTLDQQFDRYRVFLKAVPPGTAKQYVDLRVSGKVVYR